jgi:hypothetical protein
MPSAQQTSVLLTPRFWLLASLLELPTSLADITLGRQMQKLRRASLVLLGLLGLLVLLPCAGLYAKLRIPRDSPLA